MSSLIFLDEDPVPVVENNPLGPFDGFSLNQGMPKSKVYFSYAGPFNLCF